MLRDRGKADSPGRIGADARVHQPLARSCRGGVLPSGCSSPSECVPPPLPLPLPSSHGTSALPSLATLSRCAGP